MAKKDYSKREARPVTLSTKSAAAVQAGDKRAARRDTVSKSEARAEGRDESGFTPGALQRVASKYWQMIVPVALALITSISTLSNDFASDDLLQVVQNEFIKKLSNIPAAFTTSVWAFMGENIVFAADQYYRPMFNSLFTINYQVAGLSPWLWHLVNVLIHAVVTLLVFAVIKELTGRKLVAVIAASIFAVHPANTEAVAWVSGVTDPLMSVMLLLAFYFYLRYRKSERKHLIILSLGFFFLALLSKETALAFPLILACMELIYFEDSLSVRENFFRALKFASLFLAPVFVYLLMRYNALGMLISPGQSRYPLAESLMTIPLAIAKYLKLMFVPAAYSYQHYTLLVESIVSIRFIAPLALILAIIAGVWLAKSRELKLAALWFILLLAPALAAISRFDPEFIVQERYLYLPSMGICLAAALAIEWLVGRKRIIANSRKAAFAITAVIVIGLGIVHIKQNSVWQDSVSLLKNCVSVNPDSSVAHAVLARCYYDLGRPREAEDEANRALEIDPANPTAYMVLSYFAQQSTKYNKAIFYLETALASIGDGAMTRKDRATIHLNLARMHAQRAAYVFKQTKVADPEDMAQAEENFLRSIEILPRPVAWFYTGQFYLGDGRYEEAIAMYQRVLNNTPDWFAPVHLQMGLAYEGLKQTDRAIAEFQQYLKLAHLDANDRKNVEGHIKQLQAAPPPQ